MGAGLGAATGICAIAELPRKLPGASARGQEWVLQAQFSQFKKMHLATLLMDTT